MNLDEDTIKRICYIVIIACAFAIVYYAAAIILEDLTKDIVPEEEAVLEKVTPIKKDEYVEQKSVPVPGSGNGVVATSTISTSDIVLEATQD